MMLRIEPGRQGFFAPLGGVKSFALRPVDWRTFKPDWNHLRFESTADRFEIMLNGKSVLKFTEFAGGFPPGYVGIMSAGSGMRYRNIRIWDLPPPPAEPGWGQLFNGKDLTGWVTEKEGNGKWKVTDGAISCYGPTDYLYTKRDDFGDFHLRAEAKINEWGNSGIYFRVGKPIIIDDDAARPYEAQITNVRGQAWKTGSLYGLSAAGNEAAVGPDTWFTYEIIATRDRIRLLVNGKETASRESQPDRRAKGYIALQHLDAGTRVQFRKIEIKELPPAPVTLAPDLSKAKPLYDAHLKKPIYGWPIAKDSYFTTGFENGGYFIAVAANAARHVAIPAKPIDDFAIEVVSRITGSPASEWALRVENLAQKHPFIDFKLNGKQELEIMAGGRQRAQEKRLWSGRHDAIKPGEGLNKLLVVSRRGKFEVYVNGIPVCNPMSADFVQTPVTFAVSAYSGEFKPSKAEFERFTVWPIDALPDERRAQARKVLATGGDPGDAKKEAKRLAAFRSANAFEVVAREWFEKRKHEWAPRSVDTMLGRLALVLEALKTFNAEPKEHKWRQKPSSNRPTIRLFFDTGYTVRALMKIGLNLLAAYCKTMPVNRSTFDRAMKLIMRETELNGEVVFKMGFVKPLRYQSIAKEGCHSFRLLHLNETWLLHASFFGGKMCAFAGFPGPNHEAWVCLDVTAPIKSTDWKWESSAFYQPLDVELNLDASAELLNCRADLSRSEIRVEVHEPNKRKK